MDFIHFDPSAVIIDCFEGHHNNEFDIKLNEILVAAVSLDKKNIHESDEIFAAFNSDDRLLIEKTRDSMGISTIKKLIIDVMFANKDYYEFYLNKAQKNRVISSFFCERAWREIHKTSLSFKHVSKDYLCVFATRLISEEVLNIIQNKYIHSEIKLFPIERYYEKCEYLLSKTLPMLGMADGKSVETYKMYGFSALQEVLLQTLNDKFPGIHPYPIDKDEIIKNILYLYYKNDAPKYNFPTESLLHSMAKMIAESVFNVKKFNVDYVTTQKNTEPCYKMHLDKKTTKKHLIEYMSSCIKPQIKKHKGEQVVISYTPPLADFICSHGLPKETQPINSPFYAEKRENYNTFYDTEKKKYDSVQPQYEKNLNSIWQNALWQK